MQFMPGRTVGAKIIRILTFAFLAITVVCFGATIFIEGRISEIQSQIHAAQAATP